MSVDPTGTIEGLLIESRKYPPPPEFAAKANVNDPDIYERALEDPEGFWASVAENLDWDKKWDKVLDWDPPKVSWFTGGKLNVSYNCVDRHTKTLAQDQSGAHLGGRIGRGARSHISGSLS